VPHCSQLGFFTASLVKLALETRIALPEYDHFSILIESLFRCWHVSDSHNV
jgi:hypothetical protein